MKNISSVILILVFTDICAFCFSSLVPANPQKCSMVWYTSKHGVAHNPTLHSRSLNYVLVSLLLVLHTQHRILLHCFSQRLLCLVAHGSWMELIFPCLAVKMLSGEGSALACGGSVRHTPLGPPANLLATDTVHRQFILTIHCGKFVPVKPFSVTAHQEWLRLPIKSRQSPSLKTRPSDSVRQASAVPGMSYAIALRGSGIGIWLQCSQNRHKTANQHLSGWSQNQHNTVNQHLSGWSQNWHKTENQHLSGWSENRHKTANQHSSGWSQNWHKTANQHLSGYTSQTHAATFNPTSVSILIATQGLLVLSCWCIW